MSRFAVLYTEARPGVRYKFTDRATAWSFYCNLRMWAKRKGKDWAVRFRTVDSVYWVSIASGVPAKHKIRATWTQR